MNVLTAGADRQTRSEASRKAWEKRRERFTPEQISDQARGGERARWIRELDNRLKLSLEEADSVHGG